MTAAHFLTNVNTHTDAHGARGTLSPRFASITEIFGTILVPAFFLNVFCYCYHYSKTLRHKFSFRRWGNSVDGHHHASFAHLKMCHFEFKMQFDSVLHFINCQLKVFQIIVQFEIPVKKKQFLK